MSFPEMAALLPELMQFSAQLATALERGEIDGWPDFSQRVRAFFTLEMMAEVERYVPGWGAMAAHSNQQTLIHVTSVLTALRLLPEYQQAAAQQQALMAWVVLWHDIAKVPRPGKHDYVHGFRSAAQAGRGLAQTGFSLVERDEKILADWCALTHDAVIYDEDLQEWIQDNRRLSEIVAGIDRLFGAHTPAGWIIRAVLLHISLVTDPDYPIPAPLRDAELRRFMGAEALPLLKMMLLVDADGWMMFDTQEQTRIRRETLDVFARIAGEISL